MPYPKTTVWGSIKLVLGILYSRFIWKPKKEGAKEDGKKES